MTFLDENHWRPLAEALREELKEYGWLLSLLDKQQRGILDQDYDGFPDMTHTIEEQIQVAFRQRRVREDRLAQVQELAGVPAGLRMKEFCDLLPSGARELFHELLRELQHTITRLQKRSRQNKLLLARAQEMAVEIVSLLRPTEVTRTYTPRGSMQFKAPVRAQSLSFHA